jgi:hypothetical protein
MPVAEFPERRSPPPWSVEEMDACFIVPDNAGKKLAYVYFEDEPGRRSAAKLLSKDERGTPALFGLRQLVIGLSGSDAKLAGVMKMRGFPKQQG